MIFKHFCFFVFFSEVETKCKTITSISNGWIRPTPIPNHCGGKVKFSCDRGYKLIGSSSVVCSKTSQWSAEIPRCEGKLRFSWIYTGNPIKVVHPKA